MNERLEKLKALLDELRSDAFGDCYGIADFIDEYPYLKIQSEKLSAEISIYDKALKDIENFQL